VCVGAGTGAAGGGDVAITATERKTSPLLAAPPGEATAEVRARDLVFEECPKMHAVEMVRAWHSRLPNTQRGPWTHAFRGHVDDTTYVVALWNNCSARTLPQTWRELRRMACAPDAPRNTASRFLGWMARWFLVNEPAVDRLISYQGTAVHEGTIYKAAGWVAGSQGTERVRDRSRARTGTTRLYRKSINGQDADASRKIRWEKACKVAA
jgi:hypothetical protein